MPPYALLALGFALVAPVPRVGTEARDAAVTRTASPAVRSLEAGRAKLRADDFDGAITDFQRALAQDLASPEGYYHVAVTHRRVGRHDRALEYFRQALDRARTLEDRPDEARALVGIAMTFDVLPGRIDDAHAAWTDVRHFAERNPSLVPAGLYESRLSAFDAMQRARAEAAEVRARIEARVAEQARPGRRAGQP